MHFIHWLFANWIYVHIGVPGSGPYYGFWSGFGSDLGEYVIAGAIIGGVYHALRARNCETHRCWRIGVHRTAAGHRVCKKHNPDGPHFSHEHILREHFKALERLEHGGNV